MLVGDLLVIAALFSPWLDVFKIGDPDFPGIQEYGPWIALQHGSADALGVAAWVYVVMTLAMAVSTLVLMRAHASDTRSIAAAIAAGLALAGLLSVGLVLPGLHTALALNYPYYDTSVVYGAGFALAGFACVIAGAASEMIG